MATGAEHYSKAEQLLGYATNIDGENRGCPEELSLFAEAQAHAILALVAATAAQLTDYDDPDGKAWASAIGRGEE